MKSEREYHGCGEENHMEKRERGSNIIFTIIFRLLGNLGCWEVYQVGKGGRGRKENQDLTNNKLQAWKKKYCNFKNINFFISDHST